MILPFAILMSLCAVGSGQEPAKVEPLTSKICPRNEQWYKCRCGENTCYDPYSQIFCIQCLPGCFCKRGYVRNDNNKCVLISNCPQTGKCPGKNELFQRCHRSCDPTCTDTNDHCKGCFFGCFCEPGFVRNDNNECIDIADCPKTCGNNEIWSECACFDLTCENPTQRICGFACAKGCFCKEGYVRNQNNKCVKFAECPINL